MDISVYLRGRGIDVSREAILVDKRMKHYFVEPNNFYTLKENFDFESLDFIYSNNLINETKFFKILLKEWFNFCKLKGYIIIVAKTNRILNSNMLIDECNLLFFGKAKIIAKEEIDGQFTVIIQKTKQVLNKKDSMDKWSFGILSDGKRPEQVEKEIESIRALKIPHYEIIICGRYLGDKNNDVQVIDFNPEKPWITKKKNLLCAKSKYENLVITHDRFTFDSDWYSGMKKYGNYFEILSCNITDIEGKRVDDWITYGRKMVPPIGLQGLMDPKDWDKNGYIDGGIYILKKDTWRKVRWDENLYWGQAEDLKLSKDFIENGFVARFNPYSSVKTSSKRWQYPYVAFDSLRQGKYTNKTFIKKLKHFVKTKILIGYYNYKFKKTLKNYKKEGEK